MEQAKMEKKTIEDVELKGKVVIMRVDYNVPLKDGEVQDNTRIKASLESVNYLLSAGVRGLILMSHFGNPQGKVDAKLSLKPVCIELSNLLGKEVSMGSDCIGKEVKEQISNLGEGGILLLENLRFHEGEKKNDLEFAKELSSLGDIYVNDAFGTTHRSHASTVGISKYLPSVSGFLIEKELKYLSFLLSKPSHPFVAIIGGYKVSSKIGVLYSLLDKVDTLIIGGCMAYTFSYVDGRMVGNSFVAKDYLAKAKDILAKGREKGVDIIVPIDHVITDAIDDIEDEKKRIVRTAIGDIPDGFVGADIGEKTIDLIKLKLAQAKTVLWNGPLGVFEIDCFAGGTRAIAKYLSKIDGTTIIGGGDSVSAINEADLQDKFSHISTGGGASIELISGNELPGIEALNNKI